ncbi:MAG: 2-amino-4-hydroxy-6-hydroxymethyldihydropteridine diphosphokinase [Chitinophagaceae bacterium]|nr:MAG: 2-amino-4-hydroxy-6-hydroxymethyldihydropteridine diphosphokinase [Chitinophagaceae bacterium]
MITVYLLLGTNMGDRLQHLKDARELLGAGDYNEKMAPGTQLTLLQESSIYETAAWGKIEQDDYLNQVIAVSTDLPPLTLLKITSCIETRLGRVRKKVWEPRIIDIDILLYENEIIREEKLIVPHPHLQNRRFVLTPLSEIAPHLLHPVLGKDILTLLEECPDTLWVRKCNGI